MIAGRAVSAARRVASGCAARLRALRVPRHETRWLPRSRVGRRFTAALAVITAATLMWYGSRSALFDVDHIEVVGTFLVSPAEAAEAAGPLRRVPLADLDTTSAAERIEALPFVRSATVQRVFPNRVRIRLTERMPVAFAARTGTSETPHAPGGGFALLDETGRVLADRPDRPADLPEVTGTGQVPPPGRWLRPAGPALDVYLALPDGLRGQVSAVVVDGGSTTLRMGAREVRFGPPESLEAKVAALGALLEHLGDRSVAAIDVRVPSAPVVLPAGPPADQNPAATTRPAPRD